MLSIEIIDQSRNPVQLLVWVYWSTFLSNLWLFYVELSLLSPRFSLTTYTGFFIGVEFFKSVGDYLKYFDLNIYLVENNV